MEPVTIVLIGLVQKYPLLMSVIAVMGTLRLINKPLFTFLRTFVSATPGSWDDRLLNEVEQSKAYKVISFILDYLGSIKLPEGRR